MLDHCDIIGLVHINFRFVSTDCGAKISEIHAIELGDRVQDIGGGKFFIPKFIPFQYGRLSESCRPHERVIEAIRMHGLTLNQHGYAYPMHRVSDRVSDRVNIVQEEEEDKDKSACACANKARATLSELMEFCKTEGLFPRDAEYMFSRWSGNGWKISGRAIKDWKAAARAWKAQGYLPTQKGIQATDCWPSKEVAEPEVDLMSMLLANRAKAETEAMALAEPPEIKADDTEWN